MKSLPIILMFFWGNQLFAQILPDSATTSSQKMASYLQLKFKNSSQQLAVLYQWIIANIKYDKDSALFFNYTSNHEEKIAATLRRRRDVCENYASLMADVATKLNITAFVVHGYPAHANKNKDNSHSWVAIKNNNEWLLCDPTWDAQMNSTNFYMISPTTFIQTHIPFDPLWQLLENPVDYKTNGKKFMYADSADYFLKLDSLQQLIATEYRIKKSTAQNSMTQNWQGFTKMNRAIIAGEKDEQLYNKAVEMFNKANNVYNFFVEYRNNDFQPLKTKDSIKAMLQPISHLLQESLRNIDELGKWNENFQYNPETLLLKIAALKTKVEEQQSFAERHFSNKPNATMNALLLKK